MSNVIYRLAFAAVILACSTPAVSACPRCKEAIEAAGENDTADPYREALAFNHSIYLMAGMPYALLGGFGFFVYRSSKRPSPAAGTT